MTHHEVHRSHRTGWLRASVLGANDGVVSTASLIIGVAAANASQADIILAGLAGLVAGAMSMAAGEYVSVSSQADTEKADLDLEKKSLIDDPEFELNELAEIYEERGLDSNLAKQVAEQLTRHGALEAHARDEIGIVEQSMAKPIQAAFSSAFTFTIGAVLPLLAVFIAPETKIIPVVASLSLIFLASLGGIAARIGGAPISIGVIRVTFWGVLAMAITALVGRLFGVVTS